MVSVAKKLISLAVAATLSTAAYAAEPEKHTVQALPYGDVLFHFFQGNYFTALTESMADRYFARLGPHLDEAELLRGGMLLEYGAHVEAGRIFEDLIESGAPPAVRDRAWFHLAKIRYQRGYIEQAEDALARVAAPLPGDLENERLLLHSYLLMKRSQYPEAIDMLKRVSPKSEWSVYGHYNLGVAMIKAGGNSVDAGVQLLETLGATPSFGEERAALKDKANVALAYTFLQDGNPTRAKTYLERVRLTGLQSNKALLGMGWAYAALNQHEQALVPWTELSTRAVADAAVQESLLAVPYAYGKAGAYGQALERYETALTAYTHEIESLDEAIASIRAGKYIAHILETNPVDESGWYWRMDTAPETPETRYLTQLLASHEFQEALKNYRDLRFLQENLEKWSRHLEVNDDMVANRRQAFAERLPKVLSEQRTLDIERLDASRAQYATEIERIEREQDAAALANDKERALLQRLQRVDRTLAQTPATEMQEARDKSRLLNGLLAWDLSANYQARLWDAKKHLQGVDKLITEAGTRRAALAQAQVDAPASFDDFAKRIGVLRGRVSVLRTDVAKASDVQGKYLADLAAGELGKQRERIVAYVTQARFAVAQIYDEAVRSEGTAP
ncbi:MAG: hypothetical protein HY308_14885 [Gammaproteobacteria bacterium]|nr:hypothetical protein [Gammaproteobacteria bacterium]